MAEVLVEVSECVVVVLDRLVGFVAGKIKAVAHAGYSDHVAKAPRE